MLHAFLHDNKDLTSNLRKLHTLFCTLNDYIINNNCTAGFICYDDGCHLKKYALNSDCAKLTFTSKILATMNIVYKLHFKGHTDKWCQDHCNPHKFDELKTASLCVCMCIIYILIDVNYAT